MRGRRPTAVAASIAWSCFDSRQIWVLQPDFRVLQAVKFWVLRREFEPLRHSLLPDGPAEASGAIELSLVFFRVSRTSTSCPHLINFALRGVIARVVVAVMPP